MIGVSLSDLHLGFTGPGRTVNGRSGREIDVEIALGHAVDRIIEVQPDLVTIAGDVFHSTRPSYHAVRALQQSVRRIVTDTSAHLVVIPGNHESPRTAAALSPNVVIEGASNRVHYVDEFKTIVLHSQAHDEGVAIACAPFSALGLDQQYRLEPIKGVDVNILLIHAAVRTSADPHALPHFYGAEGIDVAQVEGFDVIACGDYHEFTRLHPDRIAFYSGAIERTSSNIWQETAPKGVVHWDTDQGLELLAIPTRWVSDYQIPEADSDASLINNYLDAIAQNPQTRDALVRLKGSCSRHSRDMIDWKLVRDLKTRCFHFQLDLEFTADESVDLGDRRATRGITLREAAAEFFANDPPEIRECALGYLEAAA